MICLTIMSCFPPRYLATNPAKGSLRMPIRRGSQKQQYLREQLLIYYWSVCCWLLWQLRHVLHMDKLHVQLHFHVYNLRIAASLYFSSEQTSKKPEFL